MTTRTVSPVGLVLLVLLVFTLFAPFTLHAGGRRRAVAAPRPSSDLTVTFVDGLETSDAMVDAGTMSWSGKGPRVVETMRSVAIRIGPSSREARGFATLRAFLEMPDPRYVVSVNGVVLSATPRVVESHVPIGIAVAHRIEIEVPTSVPAGSIAATIAWEVTTD